MLDVSEAFEDLEETVILKRKAAGDYDGDGEWVNGVDLPPKDILGVVQSLSSDELLILPEGERTKETVKIHTKIELFTANEDLKINADNIEYQGNDWTVAKLFNRNTLGSYYKAILIRL